MQRKVTILITGAVALFFIIYWLANFSPARGKGEANVYDKISEGSNIRYLVIGDSIARGSGAETMDQRWYTKLEVLLKGDMGIVAKRQSLVQSGATAFEGIYRLQNAARLTNADLIFIFFGENDRKYMGPEEFSFFYEKLLRDAKMKFPNAEIITITESPLKQPPFAKQIERISYHYGAKNIDMRKHFKDTGMLTEKLTSDTVHPNGKGYQLYANAIFNLLKKNSRERNDIALLKKPLTGEHDFVLTANSMPEKTRGFKNKNGMYISNVPGNFLEFQFEGPMLGVTLSRRENGGMMNVYVDGEYVRTMSTWWPFPRERNLYVTSGLEQGKHTARFEVINDVSPHNSQGIGTIQISSVFMSERIKD
ncbi:SGNH/GDSL hydrolase family protein [Mesobacillus zeae]|uniref:SGNH/GDSL hydrolase family protein n=1 Tax=Mesobacillus zeae TaxID=1917180 RepID=A0A398B3Y6_9BACI|nr:SGNH/GDSL hydrolase family protein [Mesobacillus zeae]RID84124.1 SGNH/GDSL hydrolase family protein [Mesobacillus zeae]